MLRLHTLRLLAVALSIALASDLAFAQHDHGDIEFTYESGRIAIEFGDEGRVFEGDFGDFAGGPDETDDPGFGSEVDEGLGVDPGDIIGYKVLGPLNYHDGSAFAATSASMALGNAGGVDITVDAGTLAAGGLIGQADSAGDVHTHIDFAINSTAPTGAYGLLLSLTAFDSSMQPKPGIADSEPFYIVFNRGLDEVVFEEAVGAFAATIPEPASLMLASIGAAVVCGRRRR